MHQALSSSLNAFHPDQLLLLSSCVLLSYVVVASYHLCSHPFLSQANSFPFPLHWPLPTLLPLPGFGKGAGVAVSLVLAVGKVIKGDMKRHKGTVQR